jgi:hypothetical protein
MLAIAIILGIAMVLNVVQTEGNYNVLMASALIISLWGLSLTLAIVVLVLLGAIGLKWFFKDI